MYLIRQENYPVEKHTLETKDGYILTMHRIPNKNGKRQNRQPILFMHGEFKFVL